MTETSKFYERSDSDLPIPLKLYSYEVRTKLLYSFILIFGCAGLIFPSGAGADTVPNDPNYVLYSQPNLQKINLEKAWDTETGSHDVVVAVIDTGVNYSHEELAGNIWTNLDEIAGNGIDDDNNGYIDDVMGWDFVDVDSAILKDGEDGAPTDNDPMDFGGHGTAVAGIIGAVGNNAVGTTGVSWNVSIMPLRCGFISNTGQQYIINVPEALRYACDNGADIVNISSGDTVASQSIKDAVDYCVDKGVLMVAGAGNLGTTKPSYPAAFTDVLGVANTSGDFKYSTSNYGIWVDISAPGASVYTTAVDGGYTIKYGTSMSAPMVSGVAALIKAANPTYTAEELKRHLLASTVSLTEEEPAIRMGMGAGLVQADLTVNSATLPERAKTVSLSMGNNTNPNDAGFYEGDVITIRPTVRNISANDPNLTIALTISDPDSALTPLDSAISLQGVGLDEKRTSWSDTLQVLVGQVSEPYQQETFTLTISNGQGVVAQEDFTVTLNPLLSKQSLLTDSTLASGFERPKLTEHPDGSLSAVFESLLTYSTDKQLYHCLRDVNGTWGDIVALPNSPDFRQRGAVTAMGNDGQLHLAYGQYDVSGVGSVYYNVYDPLTATWGQPTEIAPSPSYKGLKSKINISLDQNDNPIVIWSDWRNETEGDIRVARFDGVSWLAEEMVADLTAEQDPSQTGDFQQVACFVDVVGNPLAIWIQSDGIYSSRKVSGVWETPVLMATDQDFNATADSQGVVHLVTVSSVNPTNSTANYSNFDGVNWSPITSPIGSFGRNTTKVLINDDGLPEIYTLEYESSKTGLYRTVYNGQNWSAMSLVTANELAQAEYFTQSDVLVTASGEIVYALSDSRFSWDQTPINVASSDPSLVNVPDQPQVTLRGSEDDNQVVLEFSSSQTDGIAGYFIALGSAPGQDDLSTWFEKALVTDNQYTLTLGALPWRQGQVYYASVRALGNNGYLSAVGSSQGIPSVDLFSGPESITVGETATLTWKTTNAVTVTIGPDIGEVAADGSIDLSPAETTVYTLTATGVESSISQDFTVTVNATPPAGGASVQLFDDGGGYHTCTVAGDDSVRCWGRNNSEQLGNNTYIDQSVPIAASNISNSPVPIIQVVGGMYHSCALFEDGTAKCWGRGASGRLGNGSIYYDSLPVSVIGLDNAVQIAAGQDHTCAVLEDGGVKCWGYNYYGQLGDGTTVSKSVPTQVANISNAVQVVLGKVSSCALLDDGTIKCWGYNNAGQLGLGYYSYVKYLSPDQPVIDINNATQITSGDSHACAALADGTAKCWGVNFKGQLGNGVLYNPSGWAPTTVMDHENQEPLTEISQIAAGYYHTCVTQTDGTASCWGSNTYHELGANETDSYSTNPVTIAGVTGVTSLVVGDYHNCAFSSGSSTGMFCWGRGDYGQLGNDATLTSATPVEPLL